MFKINECKVLEAAGNKWNICPLKLYLNAL